MKILEELTDNKGRFYILKDGKEMAEMTFSRAGEELIIIDHTAALPEFRGEGGGLALVMYAVNYARENKLKIMPLCPYASSVFMKNPEIRDVLK
jgi:predicted GNAT family acetyltransferase